MKKLTRDERRHHERAQDLLWGSDKPLTVDEMDYIYENWLPYADHAIDVSGAFFTPLSMAHVVAQYAVDSGRMLDLCAGAGILSYAMMQRQSYGGGPILGAFTEIVAVEVNEAYVSVGKRLLPDVTWVHGDALDAALWLELGVFDGVVANPPFGRVRGNSQTDTGWLSYQGANDLMLAEVALRVAGAATMILPYGSVPYSYGRGTGYSYKEDGEWKKFQKALPGASFHPSSWPTAEWDGQWKGANPRTEIVSLEIEGVLEPLGVLTRTSGELLQPAFF